MNNPQLTGKKIGNYPAPIIPLESGTIRLRCASDGHLDQLRTPRTGVRSWSPSPSQRTVALAPVPRYHVGAHGEHDRQSLSAHRNPPGRLIEAYRNKWCDEGKSKGRGNITVNHSWLCIFIEKPQILQRRGQ
jgi:hypothetical protein